ncbi:hypothetical protein ACFE04_002878 [Oxalis oulophora]
MSLYLRPNKKEVFACLVPLYFIYPHVLWRISNHIWKTSVIYRMVREAEEFADEDKKVKERIDARNSLETYVYNMKNQVSDKDKLADKLEADEKEKVETAVKEALEWLDDNQTAEKEDYDEKLKEVEAVCNPIISAVYQRSGGAPGGGASTEEDDDSHDEL